MSYVKITIKKKIPMESEKKPCTKKLVITILSAIAAAITAVIGVLSVESCGSPKSLVKVRNNADCTTTTITSSVGNGGNVSVSVTPDVSITLSNPTIK